VANLFPVTNLLPTSLIWAANLPPVSTTPAVPVANLLPVLLITVVHLDLRIFLQIFEKIQNDPNVIFRGLWEDDS
jgi:hypothetical protein